MNRVASTGVAIALGFSAVFVTTPTRAFDMDCKLILCLAGGFPSGCSDAKSYMLDRLKDRKPPIGTCSSSGGSDGEYRVPVRIFSRHYPHVCTKNVYVQEGEGNSGYQCQAWGGGYSDRLIGITIPVDAGPDYSNEFLWYRTVHTQGDK